MNAFLPSKEYISAEKLVQKITTRVEIVLLVNNMGFAMDFHRPKRYFEMLACRMTPKPTRVVYCVSY